MRYRMDSHNLPMRSMGMTASRLASPVPLENQHRSPATSSRLLGHATIIVMTKQDLKNWRAHFSHSEPQPMAKRPLKVSLSRSSRGNHRKPIISGARDVK